MLALDSPRWKELNDIYGPAAGVPELLRRLQNYPPADEVEDEPFYSLWSGLYHQGDVSTASYAALPHLVRIQEGAPAGWTWSNLHLIAMIEIGRAGGRGPAIPDDLAEPYHAALKRIPDLIPTLLKQPLDEGFCRVVLAAAAVAAGHARLGDAVLELEPQIVEKLLETWIYE